MVGVVQDPEVAPDHLSHTRARPQVGGVAGRQRPTPQEPHKLLLLAWGEASSPAGVRFGLQARRAASFQEHLPALH